MAVAIVDYYFWPFNYEFASNFIRLYFVLELLAAGIVMAKFF